MSSRLAMVCGKTHQLRYINRYMKLTRKQKAFANHLINNPKDSATKAVQATYKTSTNQSARAIASQNLTKPGVLKYLGEHVNKAENTIIEVMNNSSSLKDEPAHARIALDSSREVLNRTIGMPVQRTENRTEVVSINLDLTGVERRSE